MRVTGIRLVFVRDMASSFTQNVYGINVRELNIPVFFTIGQRANTIGQTDFIRLGKVTSFE